MLARLAKQTAVQTLSLRAGIVGANFAVMLLLAGFLGFEVFGRLAALWGAALVAGTVMSLGGPVILLRMLTDGQGLRLRDIVKIAFVFPGLLAFAGYVVAASLWSGWPWGAILGAGFLTNALGCLASVMRAMGSVQTSMTLRDAGPQVALGLAGIGGGVADAEAILFRATFVMLVIALLGLIWIWRSERSASILSPDWRRFQSFSLWATSVLGMVVAQIDLIVGGALIPAEQLGVYAVLRRVANLVALPVTVATWVSGPAVSTASGQNDQQALRQASASGSHIAMMPGLALFGVGLLALPALPFLLPGYDMGVLGVIFAALLLGALGQVIFASSFTVATLCGLARLALVARLTMITCYLLWLLYWGPALSVVTNALGYVFALTLSGAALWWGLWRAVGVDTSAAVLLRAKGVQWKTP